MRGPDPKNPEWIREWYDTEKTMLEWDIPLDAQGKRHGQAIQYYRDGKTKLTRTYVHGREQGTETLFYPDGTIYHTLEFVDGLKHGLFTDFLPNGKLYRKVRYVEGRVVSSE